MPDVGCGARIRASGWGWRHSGRRAWAVHDLDLEIEPGERVLLLGASGSGKSTLLAALAGVLGVDEGERAGELLVDGREPREQLGHAGLVLQDPDSQVVLSRVGDDVAFGCENLGVPRDETWRRVSSALESVGLQLPLDHPTNALSGGQKQRLALAGVLAMRPGLVLLDEPTANLDPGGVAEVRAAVAGMLERSSATLIVIEHRVDVWRDLVDRVIILDSHGGVLADGPITRTLVERGRELADSGVWVSDFPPATTKRLGRGPATEFLRTAALAVGRDKSVPVAHIPDLAVSSGRLTAITGPNGSGKTTLALTLGGLLRPIGGSVTADAALAGPLTAEPWRWKSRQLVTRIGNVFQDPEHQFLGATVREELEVGPRAVRMSAADTTAAVDQLLERLRLTHLERANPFTLSGGEKRRLSVATALVAGAKVLVLDEPTFGQDSRTWSELVALIAERLDAGTAVAAVSHDAAFVGALADQVTELGQPNETGVRVA